MTDDVMERLASIQPLPRGERLARYVDQPSELKPGFNALWEHLFDGSRTLNALDNLFALDDVYPSRLVSLRTHADRWRAYAAPLRKARERLKFARACANVLHHEVERLRAKSRKPPCGWCGEVKP